LVLVLKAYKDLLAPMVYKAFRGHLEQGQVLRELLVLKVLKVLQE
jgi:hypothetical protein